MRQVAIVGLSSTTHDLAPWVDSYWEKWGLPWDEGYWVKCSRLFEMHDLRLLESKHSKRSADYLERLKEIDVPLYMQEKYFENVTEYPFDEVAKTTGYYFNSSIAYAIALAIHEQVDRIGVFGVDMKGDDEYGYQKPNIEYLLGLAKGMGIDVVVPEQSPLLKFQGDKIWFYGTSPKYVKRYGWLGNGDINVQ